VKRLELMVSALGLAEQPRVLERDADDVADRLEELDLARLEGRVARRRDVHDADDGAHDLERHPDKSAGAFGANLLAQVAAVGIVDDEGLAGAEDLLALAARAPVARERVNIARRDAAVRRERKIHRPGIP